MCVDLKSRRQVFDLQYLHDMSQSKGNGADSRHANEYSSSAVTTSYNCTNNPYARVLYFYYLFHRLKLTTIDLNNIAKKYANNAPRLLHDLTTKYKDFAIPEEVHLSELNRVCSLYDVPENYHRLLQPFQKYDYNPRVDIYSREFDAEYSLLSSQSISHSHVNAPTLDNISKFIFLKSGSTVYDTTTGNASTNNDELRVNEEGSIHVIVASENSKRSSNDTHTPKEPREAHFFEQIALRSIQSSSSSDGGGETSHRDSPLAFLYDCMNQKIRVTVVVRRRNSVRGSLTAYVKTFDKNFNLFLSDVDEEYITNKQKRRSMVMGRFKSSLNVYKR